MARHARNEADRQASDASPSAAAANERARKFSEALFDLARNPVVVGGDVDDGLRAITRTSGITLPVERTGVWLFDEAKRKITCVTQYLLGEDRFESGHQLSADDNPEYFAALATQHILDADDALTDPRTAKFAADYLKPQGIRSMMDCPVFLGGKLAGIVCNEHVGDTRSWTVEEKTFAGSIAGFVSRALEAAERVRIHSALEASESKYRALLEQIPAIAYVASVDVGHTEFVGPQVETYLGFTPEEWVKSPELWLRQVHRDDRERVLDAAESARRHGIKLSVEYRIFAKDGRELWVRDEASVVRDSDGQPLFLNGMMLDITDQKRAEETLREREEQLLHSQKMEAVGRLAGGIAHDFNNLLTAIVGYSDLALLKTIDGQSAENEIREIKTAAHRAGSLTTQLLAFSRKQVMHPELLNLNSVTRDMTKMLQRLIGEDITLEIVSEPELGAVTADPGQIQQVILNLVVNARDAMPRGGSLVLQTMNVDLEPSLRLFHRLDLPPGRYVMLAARDSGVGIDAETKEHIFEPFFTTKERGRGTGLGLPTVYGIVRQSGGGILVDSHVGKGTSVEIYLPRVEGEAVTGESASPRKAAGGTERIILVEDDHSVRNLVQQYLRTLGYTVTVADNGWDAIQRVTQGDTSYDLLVTDVVMPGIGGAELAADLTEQLPGLDVLFISGYADEALLRKGSLLSDENLLEKPFRLEVLATRIREILDRRVSPA